MAKAPPRRPPKKAPKGHARSAGRRDRAAPTDPPTRETTGPREPSREKRDVPGPPTARPTKGEREAARRERRRRRKAHAAGLRAVRRERMRRFTEWIWPTTTRDIGRAKAVLVLLLNIAPFPGLGTILYGQWERGLLQFLLTFVFLTGWIWAIADGVRILGRAMAPPSATGPRPGADVRTGRQ